jgi:predicted  nucleic acid-binding Zn-ribbon protein
MSTINPELHEIQQQVADLRDRVAKAEGKIDEGNRIASGAVRQTIWQFVIFTVTMAAVLLGGLNYQTDALGGEFNARFDTVNEHFDAVNARFDAVNARFDAVNARFDDTNRRIEDLKQVVLARQTGR